MDSEDTNYPVSSEYFFIFGSSKPIPTNEFNCI